MVSTFPQEHPSEDLVLSVLGTWTTGRITVDGTKVTHTLELKKSADGKNYEHDWTITGADESKISHWEAKPAGVAKRCKRSKRSAGNTRTKSALDCP